MPENAYRVPINHQSASTGQFYTNKALDKTDYGAVMESKARTYPSLLSDGAPGGQGCINIVIYVLLHLLTLGVTVSAGIIYHARLRDADNNHKSHEDRDHINADESLWFACYVMVIAEPLLVGVTLIFSWSPGVLRRFFGGVPMSYTYVNQFLLGGFLMAFAATLKLNSWLVMRPHLQQVQDDLNAAKNLYGQYDPSWTIPTALYLQCFVLGFTIINPINAISKYIAYDEYSREFKDEKGGIKMSAQTAA